MSALVLPPDEIDRRKINTANGSFTLTHANNAQTDPFGFVAIG